MPSPLLTTDVLESASKLINALLEGREGVIEIILKAYASLDTYQTKQIRRTYYLPLARQQRSKILLPEIELFQYLIYLHTEGDEINQEGEYSDGQRCLHEQTLVLRFIKCLLYKSLPYRSFHLTVGLSRLLYDYKPAEVRDLYGFLVQWADVAKDDTEYRGWKAKLMKMLITRFGDLLVTCEGARGEVRFQSYSEPGHLANYVEHALERLFTPWVSSCVVSEHLEKDQDFKPFQFSDSRADAEHTIETDRRHTMIHPRCLLHLTNAFGFGHPAERLHLPQFSLKKHGSDQDPPPDIDNLPTLTTQELQEIINRLLEQRSRRQNYSARVLSIRVDGVERGIIDLEEPKSICIELEPEADLVEVYAKGAPDILLSTLSLKYSHALEGSQPWRSSRKLEGGQKIIHVLFPSHSSSDEHSNAQLEVTYQDTVLPKAIISLHKKLKNHLSPMRLELLTMKPVLAMLVLLAIGGLLFFLMQSQHQVINLTLVSEGDPDAISEFPKADHQGTDNIIASHPGPHQADSKQSPGTRTKPMNQSRQKRELRTGDVEPDRVASTPPQNPLRFSTRKVLNKRVELGATFTARDLRVVAAPERMIAELMAGNNIPAKGLPEGERSKDEKETAKNALELPKLFMFKPIRPQTQGPLGRLLGRQVKEMANLLINGIQTFDERGAVEKETAKNVLERVIIRGSRRISEEDIKSWISTHKHDVYNPPKLNDDVHALFDTGHFTDVKVFIEEGQQGGRIITFEVMDRPLIFDIDFQGIDASQQAEVIAGWQKQKIELSKGSEYDPVRIRRAAKIIQESLDKKPRHNLRVTPYVEQQTATEVSVTFKVENDPTPK